MEKQMNTPDSTDLDLWIQKPVFNKIKQNLATHTQMVDFGDYGAHRCLKKITSMIKDMDDLTTDTIIYTPNKEFLVNLVNERNGIIFQKLKENIATIRLICDMDRRYRAKNARKLKNLMENKRVRRYRSRLTEQVYEVECDITSCEPSKNEIHYLVTPGNGFTDIKFELTHPESIGKADLNKLVSNTAGHIDKRVAMSHSSLSKKEKETLYCYYSNNEVAIENINPSIKSDHVLSDVVNTMTIGKNMDVINLYSNDDAFNDITVSVSNDQMIPELFFSPDFKPLEIVSEQLPGFNEDNK
jgi:hypothetical protein